MGDMILKHILIFFFILFSSTIYANNNSVIVRITNATGADCVLEKQLALFGYVDENGSIPNAILSDQTIVFTMKSDEGRRNAILLSYACDDNRSITFFTDITPFQGMLVSDGFVVKASKIYTTFAEEHNETGRMSDSSPIEVHWRLTR